MQRPRFKVLRYMALVAMILSMSGVFGLMPATAQEDDAAQPGATAEVSGDAGGTDTGGGDTSTEGDGTTEPDGGDGSTDGGEPIVTEGDEGATDGEGGEGATGDEQVITDGDASRQAPAAAEGPGIGIQAIGNVTGYVFDASTSLPIQGATVTLSGGGVATTFSNGHYTLSAGPLFSGNTYTVTVTAPGYESGSASLLFIALVNNQFPTVYLTPDTTATGVSFAVIGADGGSMVGAPMSINGGSVFSGTVPGTGLVTTASLTPGTYTVEIGQFGPYAATSQTFTVTAADDGATFTTTVPLMRVLDAVLFVDPAVDGTYEGSCGGAPVSGSFTAGTAVMGQVYEGAYCEVTLTADGYAAGSAAGTITDPDNNGSGFISGTLGDAVPTHFPVTLTVLPTGGGSADGAFWAVYDNVNPAPIASGMFSGSNTVSVGDLATGTYTVHVDGAPIGYTFASGSYSVEGAAADWGIAIDPIPAYDVWVNVDPDVTAFFQVYNSDGDIVGEGQPFDFTTGDAYVGQLPDGEYTLLVDAEGYEFFSGTYTVAGSALTMYAVLTPLTAETFPISGIVTDLETGEPIEGALVEVSPVTGDDDVLLIAAVETTTTNADGEYSISVPNGTYDVFVSADGYYGDGATITVDGDGQIRDFALEPYEEWTTGFLEVQKFYCDDVDEVSFNAGVADDDCVTGAAYFTIYMYGDGTADYVPLNVWEDGWGYIELDEGTYTLVEEGSNAKFDFEIVAGDWTYVEVVNPGEAPAPRNGTVNVSTFSCTNIDTTIFTSDAPSVFMAAGLPTFEPACEPVATDVTFYLVGDGTDDYWQLYTKGGKGSIELAPGTYEVVEESTQASFFLEVYPGDFVSLDIQIPAGGEVIPGSSVNISKFYCDTLTEVEWLSLTDAEYSERSELAGAPDCRPGAATFTFYLYGDGTDAYAQIKVYGAGSIGLEPGTYEVVEEETQSTFTLEVLEGENTPLRVNNPMPEDGEYPGKPDHDKKPHKHHKHHKHTKSGDKKTEVTKLPETGAGSSESTDALTMAVAAAVAAAGAGALRLRKDD